LTPLATPNTLTAVYFARNKYASSPCIQVRRATMDRSGVYENVVEATKATLRQALKDAPAFTNQVVARRVVETIDGSTTTYASASLAAVWT